MQWSLIAIVVALLGVAAIFVAGARLPREHRTTRSSELAQGPPTVWAAITDFRGLVRWMPGVRSVAPAASPTGRPRWAVETSEGRMTIEVLEATAPERLVTQIVDSGLPFGGTWTYELAPAGAGTRLTITEDGWISNPLYRFFAHYVFGVSRTIDDTLKALRTHLAAQPTVAA